MADRVLVFPQMEDRRVSESLYRKTRHEDTSQTQTVRTPSAMALDAQSVKWGNCQSNNGFDANKKVKDVKRNIAVDRNGFILGRYVSRAGIHDSRLATPVCEQVSDAWPSVRKGLVDRGYRGELIENIKLDFNIDIEVCSTPNGTNGFSPKPLRWVVERTFSWPDGFRRLARNYEISDASAEEMIDFATLKLLLKSCRTLKSI